LIVDNFTISTRRNRRALLINPPIYDTRYWDKWSQPYGLLKIASLLKLKSSQVAFLDCLRSDASKTVPKKIKGSVKIGDIEMTLYHFGLDYDEIQRKLINLDFKPNEIYITSIMTYWWESTRDLILVMKKLFPKTAIILGGIYPSLCPEHAAENTKADIIVKGEVKEASNLWTELSVYNQIPDYAVITSSRGCPYDCDHCAQLLINGPGIRHREPEDVWQEMLSKYKLHKIKKFAFYEDNILLKPKSHFEKILDYIISSGLKFHLSAPEGFEVRRLYPELLKKIKLAGFKSIYLPLEIASSDDSVSVDRKNVSLEEFDKAVDYCEEAGYRPRIRQELNAFILYGLPNQNVENVIEAILYAAHRVGNVTPMLFTPVPGTRIYKNYEWYFKEKNLTLEKLNGKLFPFWELNNLLPSEYLDLQRLMYSFHTQLRGEAFNILGDSKISRSFRRVVADWHKDEKFSINKLSSNRG
jgi:radical SAM superfamily enzyme YgiQ (UPF0313 family)